MSNVLDNGRTRIVLAPVSRQKGVEQDEVVMSVADWDR